MKHLFLSVVIVIILLFSVLSISLLQGQADTITSGKIVLNARWGTNEGEIGLINIPEMEHCGPLSFCCRERIYAFQNIGDVLILDNINRRVSGTTEGKLSTIAKDVIGWTICPDGGEGFFIFNGRETVQYDSSGVKKESFPIFSKAKIIEGYGTELQLTSGRTVEINDVSQKSLTIAKSDTASSAGFVAQMEAGKAVEGRQGKIPDSLRFKIKRISTKDIRILGEDYDGKILVSVPIKIDIGYAGAVLFKGQDLKGNLYVELERIIDNHAELEIHCYSPKGERLKMFNLPNNYFTTVYKKTEVTPDGKVYQMLTTPEGVQIICY